MKIDINTNEKTIEILENVTVEELLLFLNMYKDTHKEYILKVNNNEGIIPNIPPYPYIPTYPIYVSPYFNQISSTN